MAKHKKKVYQNLCLPKLLNDRLLLISRGAELSKLYYLIWVILDRKKRKEKGISEYKAIPSEYFVKMLGTNYFRYLKILGENGLIESTDHYRTDKCYGYRIPQEFFNGEYATVKFSYRAKTDSTKTYEANKRELKVFTDNFQKLSIPFDRLSKAIDEKVNSLSIDDYSVDEEVYFQYPKMKVQELYRDWELKDLDFLTRNEALLIADQKDKKLIHNGHRLLITDPECFIIEQRESILSSWKMAVENLRDSDTLYAKRNDTNNRLDTNFTNMSKVLYEIILEHNRMIEIDLRNSQPTLLAHILKIEGYHGDGVQAFIDATESGTFYELFGDNKQSAKQMVFEVMFGKNPLKPNPENKTLNTFIEHYPAVYDYIREYKDTNGKNSLAIRLQKFESELFIDGIYYDLLKQGKTIFSKHDSISFFVEDWGVVNRTIRKHFDRMDFKGKVETSYKQAKKPKLQQLMRNKKAKPHLEKRRCLPSSGHEKYNLALRYFRKGRKNSKKRNSSKELQFSSMDF